MGFVDERIPGVFGALLVAASLGSGWTARASADEARVSFNRDVRPILSEHCFACHGPDTGSRKANLRLDRPEGLKAILESGSVAVVPGDLDASELFVRVTSPERADRMPPPKSGKTLTAAQVEILRRWIAQGADWEEHWSLIPPRQPALPSPRHTSWIRNQVDVFLLAAMEQRAIAPSPDADRITLIRRLSNDLIGLPPTTEEVEEFLADKRPDAYEHLVERLLASPGYGERMAMDWLDLVRYADTVGYHSDVDRSVWLFRDYVIRSFNNDLPFDRFTIEQIAGDLLPDPTPWQVVASAYNLLGMSTEEGGAQAREYLAKYSADRVRNLGSVWLGATLGCAECHDHKFDPYPTRDFYALAAFFADIQQPGVGTPKPTLFMPTPSQQAELARLQARIEELAAGKKRADPGSEIEKQLAAARVEKARLERAIPGTIVAVSGLPRVTRVLNRGDWMDESGEVVEPAVPSTLAAREPAVGRRATRLDLARWLVAPGHPRTARVVVNRLWKSYFGMGLAETLEDLGSQGEWPTHPELLDWLALEFEDHGWSVKHMVRLLVTSSAYRQSSRLRDDLAEVDPSNRLVARQSAIRREAELIRDQALAASGLLVRTIGGPSVRPYQPAGYWRFLNFPKRDYAPSVGPDQYRRGLYIHWQRTLLHPALLAFDAPSREMCTARRPVSNTPQAALALLNDPTQVEAARVLAQRALKECQGEDDARLVWVWRRVLARAPSPDERAVLLNMLRKHGHDMERDPASARLLLEVGQAPVDLDIDPVRLAAWTSVARTILNLDETLTRD